MDLSSLTNSIKEKTIEVGFSKSGITPCTYYNEDRTILRKWLDRNYNASMGWMEKGVEKRTNILNYYQDSKSVISVALNYFTGTVTDSDSPPFISNYALGKDYHVIIKSKLNVNFGLPFLSSPIFSFTLIVLFLLSIISFIIFLF